MKNNISPLSVVISAFNEEKKIAECLESVKWANEIIVINSSSTDKTEQIAKKYTSHVFTRPNNPMLNINKNFGFIKAKNDWILSLDADERIPKELAEEIQQLLNSQNVICNGFWISRKNMIFGKWIQNSIWWPDYQLRLFRKKCGKFAEKDIHEMIEIEGETAKLEHPMIHLNYDSISQFIWKMENYTDNAAGNIIKSRQEFNWLDAIRMPVGDFLKTFFLQKGYRDGLHGLVLSLLQSYYALIIFTKVWEQKGFPQYDNENFLRDVTKELKRISSEFHYWMLTETIGNTKNYIKILKLKLIRKRVNKSIKAK